MPAGRNRGAMQPCRSPPVVRLKPILLWDFSVDAEVLDDLEEVLITSDVGVETTVKIIRRIEERVARDKYMNAAELRGILRDEIAALMEQSHASTKDFGLELPEGTPYVLMVVGVNGAGKTTTIGKLAAKLTAAGRKVYIGAADTFRAAAIDQLAVWAERAGATMIRQEMGSDPASVAYDTLRSAVANGADVVLIDTAGRLHNKVGLMNELTKIRNVMAKVIPGAPHEVMLVLDGSTGQNAFEQARQFTQATQVTSLAITKLDGEYYCKMFNATGKLKTACLRYFNVFGQRQDPYGAYAAVIPQWFAALTKGDTVYVNGDGETSRDFCYIDNVVQANLLASYAAEDARDLVYNVAFGQRTTLNELFGLIRDEVVRHKPEAAEAKPAYRDFRAGDVRHSLADITRARTLLGYEPEYDVRQGLRLAGDWYDAHL